MNNMWQDRANGDMWRQLEAEQFKTVTINCIRETVTSHINYEPCMGSFDVFMERVINDLASSYVMGISRRVPAKEFEKTVTFQVPATWWQHFKQSHFPAWALRKFPVKYTTLAETIGFKAIYDHIIPGHNPHIQVHVGENRWQ